MFRPSNAIRSSRLLVGLICAMCTTLASAGAPYGYYNSAGRFPVPGTGYKTPSTPKSPSVPFPGGPQQGPSVTKACRYPAGMPRGTVADAYLTTYWKEGRTFNYMVIKQNDKKEPDLERLRQLSGIPGLKKVHGPIDDAYIYEFPYPLPTTVAVNTVHNLLNRDATSAGGCLLDYVDLLPDRVEPMSMTAPNDPDFRNQGYLDLNGSNFTGAWKAIETWQQKSSNNVLSSTVVAFVEGGVGFREDDEEMSYATRINMSAPDKPSPPCNPRDFCHGSTVAEVLAAKSDNKLYGAGAVVPGVADVKAIQVDFAGRTFMEYMAIQYSAGVPVSYQLGAPDQWIAFATGTPAMGYSLIPSLDKAARVVNASWGADGPCTPHIQKIIDRARDAGAIVVATAGNKLNGATYSPANCKGVIAVTGHNVDGVHVSNLGIEGQTISAPVTVRGRAFVPGKMTYEMVPLSGTSYGAPQVSATIAMMLAINPKLTQDQVLSILVATARAPGANTTRYPRLNAGAAVQWVIDELTPPSGVPVPRPHGGDRAPPPNRRQLEQSSSGDYEAGPIWSNADALGKCPAVCSSAGLSWNRNWTTTVPGRMSVCGCSQQDVQVLPASPRQPQPAAPAAPIIPAFNVLPPQSRNPAAQPRGRSGDYQAGPIWSNADALGKCPAVCSSAGLSWNRNWTTTVPGRMSVCGCQ